VTTRTSHGSRGSIPDPPPNAEAGDDRVAPLNDQVALPRVAALVAQAAPLSELLDVVVVELARALSVPADLFRAWGERLSPRRLTSFTAPQSRPIKVFVGGRRWNGSPGQVPLTRHAEIVLEAGPYVPPHSSYTFPQGA
jgi:hypothetical protein